MKKFLWITLKYSLLIVLLFLACRLFMVLLHRHEKPVEIQSRAITPVDVGTGANMHNGDPLRTAFQKVNASLEYLNDAILGTNVDTIHLYYHNLYITDNADTAVMIGKKTVKFRFDIYNNKRTFSGVDYITYNPGVAPTTPTEGLVYYRTADNKLLVYKSAGATDYDTLNGGAGAGGSGVVDTTGLPVAGQMTYFTAANKIASTPNIIIEGDSVALPYLAGSVSGGPMFLVVTPISGRVDSAWLDRVHRGLTDPLWDVIAVLNDTVNGEIAWYYIDDKTGELVKIYKLPPNMNAFEGLQYTAEMTLRMIAHRDTIIMNLEKRVSALENAPKQNESEAKFYLAFIGFLAIMLILTIILRLK